jgi:hypothetical protein
MMTPEAAASLLLSITQQQQPPRSNLSFPSSDMKLPAAPDLCLRRGRLRINSTLHWCDAKGQLEPSQKRPKV